jgi:hypothetical protein
MYWLSQQPSFRDSRCVSVHTSLGSTFGTSVPAALQQAGAAADAPPSVSACVLAGRRGGALMINSRLTPPLPASFGECGAPAFIVVFQRVNLVSMTNH